MERTEALSLIKQHVKKVTLLNHMLATEVIMRALARELKEDEALWGLTGLVHDIDFEECKEDYSDHGKIAQKILEGKVPEETLRAILSHNWERTGVPPQSKMEVGLLAADAITGLIVAAALVKPDKKLSSVTPDSVKNAFKKKRVCSWL